MYVDTHAGEYVSPPCLRRHPEMGARFVHETTSGVIADANKYLKPSDRLRPNLTCLDERGFVEDDYWWPFPPPPSRVNADGSWNR